MEPGRLHLRAIASRYGMGSQDVESGAGECEGGLHARGHGPHRGRGGRRRGPPGGRGRPRARAVLRGREGETHSVAFGLADEAGRFVMEAPAPGASGSTPGRARAAPRAPLVTAPHGGPGGAARKASVSGTFTDEREHSHSRSLGEPVARGAGRGSATGTRRTRGDASRCGAWVRPLRARGDARVRRGGALHRPPRRASERRGDEEDLHMEAGWTISGLTVDGAGRPCPGPRYCEASPGTEPAWRRGMGKEPASVRPSGVDGRFTLRHLQGGGPPGRARGRPPLHALALGGRSAGAPAAPRAEGARRCASSWSAWAASTGGSPVRTARR